MLWFGDSLLNLPRGSWLFLFAHPDDDVLIAGTVFTLVERGDRVDLAWLTDSSSLGGLVRRQAESRAAAHAMAVEQSRVHFRQLPSLAMVPRLVQDFPVVQALIEEVNADFCMVVGFEAGHTDHDCVNFLAARAAGGRPLYEYPLYNSAAGGFQINRFPQGSCEFQPLSQEAVERKHLTMQLYSSQWPYMVCARMATPVSLMIQRGEPYRLCPPDRDYSQAPHPGTLNVDRIFNRFMRWRFADFAAAVRQFDCQ